jgi:hypothetical protein
MDAFWHRLNNDLHIVWWLKIHPDISGCGWGFMSKVAYVRASIFTQCQHLAVRGFTQRRRGIGRGVQYFEERTCLVFSKQIYDGAQP